jgi:Protein of unknown function (DUF3015)
LAKYAYNTWLKSALTSDNVEQQTVETAVGSDSHAAQFEKGEVGMRNRAILLVSLLCVGFVLIAIPTWAGNYGMAGCGLGALAFPDDNDPFSQVLAATTNGTFGTQTFGITSGTSECTQDGRIRSERAQEAFAEVNFESIAREMAQGQGEHLTAFAHLLGCPENSVDEFGRLTQRNYPQIFSREAMTGLELVEVVKQSIASDATLSQTCGG